MENAFSKVELTLQKKKLEEEVIDQREEIEKLRQKLAASEQSNYEELREGCVSEGFIERLADNEMMVETSAMPVTLDAHKLMLILRRHGVYGVILSKLEILVAATPSKDGLDPIKMRKERLEVVQKALIKSLGENLPSTAM